MATDTVTDRMFSLQLPASTYDALVEFAARERRSKGFIVREALNEFFAARGNTHNTGEITGASSTAGSH